MEQQRERSGLCLSPAGGSTTINAGNVQYTCDSDPSRQWALDISTVQYQVADVGSDLCMTVADGTTALNAQAVQCSCDDDRVPAVDPGAEPDRRLLSA